MKPGKTILTEKQIEEYVRRLIDWEALELCMTEAEEENLSLLRVPYVMNDAVECYLEFADCKLQGKWIPELAGETELQLTSGDQRSGLILRQGQTNVLAIWFRQCCSICSCWQYHNIGHRWRKKKGQETWRRVVNLLCVLHDKYSYLGEEVCNEIELQLLPLITFAPITAYSPIDSSISDWYPETAAGIEAARELAEVCGDVEIVRLIKLYASASGRSRSRYQNMLTKLLDQREHRRILDELLVMLEKGSRRWQQRDYGPEENLRQDQLRQEAAGNWLRQGYRGSYPVYVKEDAKPPQPRLVRLVEEQPFTVMDWEDYQFRIFTEREE